MQFWKGNQIMKITVAGVGYPLFFLLTDNDFVE